MPGCETSGPIYVAIVKSTMKAVWLGIRHESISAIH